MLFYFNSNSQIHDCGSVPSSIAARQNYGTTFTGSRNDFEVKLNFILYAIGTNVVPSTRPQLIVDRLNSDFLGTGFTFVFDPCETQTAPITLELANGNVTDKCYFENTGRNAVGIDVHVMPDANVDPKGYAFSIPGDEILIGGLQADNVPASLSSLISHEMGHAFGLFHTFQGTCASNTFTCPNITSPSDVTTDYCGSVDGVNLQNHVGPSCTWNGVSQCGSATIAPPISNFMSYSFHQCRNMFTDCQIGRMKTLALPEVFADGQPGIVKNCTCPISDFTPTGTGKIYLTTDAAYKSVTVLAGQHLVLSGRNQIKEKVIISGGAKITLDGGTLTKCDSESQWDGVTVIGNYFGPQGFENGGPLLAGGEIEIINNGVIEYAKKGIDCNYLTYCTGICMFGPVFNFSGGLVIINNAEIRNCEVGIDFGPFSIYELFPGGPSTPGEQSSITNAKFLSCETGIKLSGNSKIDITDTEFRNYTLFGINSFHSAAKVHNSKFIAQAGTSSTGFLIHSPYGTIVNSEVTSCEFNNNLYGLYIGASNNTSQHLISDNSFTNNRTGVFSSGRSSAQINDNDFLYGTTAVYQDMTGGDTDNLIVSNSLLLSVYGFSFHGRNWTMFLDNCHSQAQELDVELLDEASVSDQQGNSDDAAGNCFSKGGKPSIMIDENTTAPFKYYLKSVNPDPCKVVTDLPFDPNMVLPVIMKVEEADFDNPTSNCGAENGIISQLPPNYSGRCVIPTSDVNRKNLLISIKQQMSTINANNALSASAKSILIARLKNCYTRVVNAMIKDGKGGPMKDAILINDLKNEPFFSVQAQVYALMMEREGLAASRTYLNTRTVATQDEIDFVMVQNHYLDFLGGDNSVATNTTKLNAIRNVAESRHQYASNAQAVYYALTGDVIYTAESHLVQVAPRSITDTKAEVFKIYPNPANDFLNIELPSNVRITANNFKVEMYSSVGTIVITQELLSEINSIDISTLTNGIYIIKISDSNNVIETKRFVKM